MQKKNSLRLCVLGMLAVAMLAGGSLAYAGTVTCQKVRACVDGSCQIYLICSDGGVYTPVQGVGSN